jgi:hypothetical protein
MTDFKKITLIAFLTLTHFFYSQNKDTIRQYELGLPLVTFNYFNSTNYFADRPSLEIFSGLFFRTIKKRVGIRGQINYIKNKSSVSDNPIYVNGSAARSNASEEIRAGLGLQISLLKKRDWLYVFGDLSYRNLTSSGVYVDTTNFVDQYSFTSKGTYSALGFGFKLKLFRAAYLSPEFGYNIIRSTFQNERTNSTTRPRIPQPIDPNYSTNNYNYSDLTVNPFVKFNLTVKF